MLLLKTSQKIASPYEQPYKSGFHLLKETGFPYRYKQSYKETKTDPHPSETFVSFLKHETVSVLLRCYQPPHLHDEGSMRHALKLRFSAQKLCSCTNADLKALQMCVKAGKYIVMQSKASRIVARDKGITSFITYIQGRGKISQKEM